MKIFANYLPQDRYDYHIGSLEKYKNTPITIFNDYVPKEGQLSLNPVNILILNEPNEFFGLHNFAVNYQSDFALIMTWSEVVLNNCPNSILFYHGETNLDLPYIESYAKNPERVFQHTYLSGILDKIEGHQLRQRVYKKESAITTPHKWWYVLDDFDHTRGNRPGYFEEKMTKDGNPIEGEGKKQVWNTNAMFHVAIENSKYNNYFTDKILDCFATKTLPIYWGAPNIGDFYNSDGIISFNDEDELVEILNKLTPEDYYSRLEAIEQNYELAKEQGFFFKRLETFLDELIKVNNL